MSTNNNPKKSETREAKRVFAAREKCEAVLAIWSERRKPAEVCREMEIPWQLLENWQQTAMKGMVRSLEPRRTPDGQRLALLSPRMEKLLGKADVVATRRSRAEIRLASIQQAVEAKKSKTVANLPNA